LEGNDQTVPGFLDLTSGRFTSDPAAPVSAQSYSWIGKRWLSVAPQMQSPDGRRYAYDGSDGIHVVDAALGTDRMILSNPPGQGLAYAAQGIYLSKHGAYAGHLGLWLLNPDTGGVVQILPQSVAFDELGSGAAWYSDARQEGPTPSTLYRIDLATAQRDVWYSQPNIWVVHLGTDSQGRPLVGWSDTRNLNEETVAMMASPGKATIIRQGPTDYTPWIVSVSDVHGLWFRSMTLAQPLWLLDSNDQVITVAQAAVKPLGACRV
jgi:type IV secretory pathway protease TraF